MVRFGVILLIGVAVALYFYYRKHGFHFPSFGGGGTSKPSAPSGGGFTGTITTKQIYKGTGQVIAGSRLFKDAKQSWPLGSGGSRPSTRWIFWKGKGSGGCVPFFNKETTIYAKYGSNSGGKGTGRSIITQGGSGQTGSNCCVYSIGFDCNTGQAYAEEEGAHDKHIIDKIGGAMNVNIGPLSNRTIGLKSILWRDSAGTHLEGYVDAKANGSWQMFYKGLNVHGSRTPVITHPGMVGDTCEEMRFRTDNIWPVDIIPGSSSIAEIAVPVSGGGGSGGAPAAPTASTTAAPPKINNISNKGATVPIAKAMESLFYLTPDTSPISFDPEAAQQYDSISNDEYDAYNVSNFLPTRDPQAYEYRNLDPNLSSLSYGFVPLPADEDPSRDWYYAYYAKRAERGKL